MDLQPAFMFATRIGLTEFDVPISETHETSSTITTYPVESGSPLTDHSYPNPRKLTMRIAHSVRRLDDRTQPQTLRMRDLYDNLLLMQELAEPVEVVTAITDYQTMLIESVVALRDKDRVSITEFTVTLKEVLTVNSEFSQGFAERYSQLVAVQNRASPTVDRANTNPETIDPESIEAENLRTSLIKAQANRVTEFLSR